MKQILVMMMMAVVAGCTAPIIGTVKNNNANMAKLSVGMTKAQVVETMGPAGQTAAYETKSGGVMEFLFYRCLLYTSPSPRDQRGSRMPSSA